MGRVIIGLASILLVGVAAVIGLPHVLPDGRGESTRGWRKFEAAGGFLVPPAGWSAHDPVEPSTRYSGHLWCHDRPEESVRMAMLRAPHGAECEIFLMAGHAAVLAPIIATNRQRYDDHPAAAIIAQGTLRSVEDIGFQYRVAGLQRGVRANGHETFLLAWARRGRAMLVVNAGGRTRDFDLATVLEVIRTVRLPGPGL